MAPTAAMTGSVLGATVAIVIAAGTVLLVVHHWLTLRRQLALQRAHHAEPQQSSTWSVEIWRQRTTAAETAAEQLRREVWLARDQSDRLSAARAIGRRQERDRLALTALVIGSNQTGQMPALSDPTAPAASVTPLNRRHRVLRSA